MNDLIADKDSNADLLQQEVGESVVPIHRDLLKTSLSKKQSIIIVGAGPVGVRFANECLKRNPDLFSIKLFGDEPCSPYDRIKLSQLLAKSLDYEKIFSDLPSEKLNSDKKEKETSNSFEYFSSAITGIDTASKVVTDINGTAHPYDKLVLAVGSKPHVPSIPGIHLKGVYTFRNMRDAEALMARGNRSRHVVVVGGGLLGLEVARALKSSSTVVTLIHQSKRLMNRQLNEKPAEEFLRRVRENQISVITEDGLAKVFGDHQDEEIDQRFNERVVGISTRTGRRIECDTVVLCTGIKPNTELALNAGIRFRQGITVNDQMQTSAHHVYAIGECCEHRQQIFGLVAPGFEQAAVLADIFTGGSSTYSGTHPYTQLKVVDELVNSMGEISDLPQRPKQQILNYRNRKTGDSRSIALHRGKIIGACAVGDWRESQRIREALNTSRYIFPWQIPLFLFSGKLWLGSQIQGAASWPGNTIVCQCNQLDKEKIDACIGEGACSVADIGSQCGAGTVCGSCQPQLRQILVARAASSDVSLDEAANDSSLGLNPALIILSLLALISATALWIFPGIQAPQSVQETNLSFLWQEKLYKQISGFSLIGVTIFGLILSLRKRLRWKFLGSFSGWRVVHIALGLLALAALLIHTGAHLGENLNRLLMVNFLVSASTGAGIGILIGFNKNSNFFIKLRKFSFWVHLLSLWPLPILVLFHVLSSYYF